VNVLGLAESELTGAANLLLKNSLEHSYNKFSGRKVKDQLSAFLPNLPGNIDIPALQDNRYVANDSLATQTPFEICMKCVAVLCDYLSKSLPSVAKNSYPSLPTNCLAFDYTPDRSVPLISYDYLFIIIKSHTNGLSVGRL
jgi:hypothetical protein